MKTISTQDLEQVTGGKGSPAANIASDSGGGSSSNDQLLSTLQNIQSSLKDLNKNQGGLFSGQNGLLFMTMALAFSRRNEVYVCGSGNCRRGGSITWRSSW